MLDFDGPRVSPAQDKVRRSEIWLVHARLLLESHESCVCKQQTDEGGFHMVSVSNSRAWKVNSTILLDS